MQRVYFYTMFFVTLLVQITDSSAGELKTLSADLLYKQVVEACAELSHVTEMKYVPIKAEVVSTVIPSESADCWGNDCMHHVGSQITYMTIKADSEKIVVQTPLAPKSKIRKLNPFSDGQDYAFCARQVDRYIGSKRETKDKLFKIDHLSTISLISKEN